MALLVLVRHGESLANVQKILTDEIDGYPLTETGIAQAKAVSGEIEKLRPTAIFSSPILRARQTAEIINSGLGLEVRFDDRLQERHFGKLTHWGGHDGRWRFEYYDRREYKTVEPWAAIEGRALEFMRSAAKEGGTAVAVSHGDTIVSAMAAVMGLDEVQAYGIRTHHCGMYFVECSGSKCRILGMNIPYIKGELLEKLKGLKYV